MRTPVYVDGFNLYYGALKDTAFKWLGGSVPPTLSPCPPVITRFRGLPRRYLLARITDPPRGRRRGANALDPTRMPS
jgi:hypothetical protein